MQFYVGDTKLKKAEQRQYQELKKIDDHQYRLHINNGYGFYRYIIMENLIYE